MLVAGASAAAWWLLRDETDSRPALEETDPAAPEQADLPPALMGAQKAKRDAPPRDVRITVIEGAERVPVEGAIVTVSGVLADAPEPTNVDGRTWIRRVPARQRFQVEVRRANGMSPPRSARIGPTSRGCTIELPKTRTVAFRIVGDDPPPSGTTVRITTGADADAKGQDVVLQGDTLVVSGWGAGPVQAWAYASDGRAAQLTAGKGPDGAPIEFRVARNLIANVTFEDGTPATGIHVDAVALGQRFALRTVTADHAGVARFVGLPPGVYRVRARHATGVHVPTATGGEDPFEFARADLSSDHGTVSGTLRRPRLFDVYVTGLTDAKLLKAAMVFLDGAPLHVSASEDRAYLRAVWIPHVVRDTKQIVVRIPGHLPAAHEASELRLDAPTVVRVALEPAARIRLALKPEPSRHYHYPQGLLALERFDPGTQTWVYADRRLPPATVSGPSAASAFVVDDIPPGRYRFVSPQTFLVSTEVEARLGDEPQVAEIDFGQIRRLHGRVEVPKRGNPMEVRIHMRAPDSVQPWLPYQGIGRPIPDGTFRLTVPTNRAVEVWAEHPTWRLKDDKPVVVDNDTEAVVLRLVKQQLAKIRLRGKYSALPRFRGVVHTMPVHFVRTDEEGKRIAKRVMARVVGPSAEFVPPEGNALWTVFFDAAPFAPMRYENIGFSYSHQDRLPGAKYLPHKKQPLVEGGSVRFELDFHPPAFSGLVATARHLGPIPYERASPRRGWPVRVIGLGPGRFRLTLRFPNDSGPPIWEGEVASDGKSEVTVQVKTR